MKTTEEFAKKTDREIIDGCWIPPFYRGKYQEALDSWPEEKLWVLEIYWEVCNFVPRYGMWPEHCEMLLRYTLQCRGDHLEIGTLWGGSAMAVSFVKSSSRIYCIDPCNKTDSFVGKTATEERVRENFAKLNLNIHLYVQKHPPMPSELADHRFDTCLIDGSHKAHAVQANWLDVKNRVDRYVIFHDIHMKGVRPIFDMACEDKDWKLTEALPRMGVVKRCTS